MDSRIEACFARINSEIHNIMNLLNEKTSSNITFVVSPSYTNEEAIAAKSEIEQMFETGQISYDKKRGLKMLITKRTIGWKVETSPPVSMRSNAANKAWVTRRANAKKSNAAHKAWATRRQNSEHRA